MKNKSKANAYNWSELSEEEQKQIYKEQSQKKEERLLKIHLTNRDVRKLTAEYDSISEMARAFNLQHAKMKNLLENCLYSEFETGLDYFNRIKRGKNKELSVKVYNNEDMQKIFSLNKPIRPEDRFSLMYSLFSHGYKHKCVCEKCNNYIEPRKVDSKVPMLINFKDGDSNNTSLNNMEIICYICYFQHVGEIAYSRIHRFEKFRNTNARARLDTQWEIPWQLESTIQNTRITGFFEKSEVPSIEKVISDPSKIEKMRETFRKRVLNVAKQTDIE